MSAIVMLEFLAIAVGIMPEDGNYFEHVSLMLESILSGVITNPTISGNIKFYSFITFNFNFNYYLF
jgi:hypothetical protein